jgi:hypothetical protein
MAQRNVSDRMGEDGSQLSIVARQQSARYEDHASRYCDGFVELEPAPVCRECSRGRRVLRWLAAVESQEAIPELWAMSRQACADTIEARFGSCSDVGLQLFHEPFPYLSFSVKGVVIIVRGTRLLRRRDCGSSQEEKELHRK